MNVDFVGDCSKMVRRKNRVTISTRKLNCLREGHLVPLVPHIDRLGFHGDGERNNVFGKINWKAPRVRDTPPKCLITPTGQLGLTNDTYVTVQLCARAHMHNESSDIYLFHSLSGCPPSFPLDSWILCRLIDDNDRWIRRVMSAEIFRPAWWIIMIRPVDVSSAAAFIRMIDNAPREGRWPRE